MEAQSANATLLLFAWCQEYSVRDQSKETIACCPGHTIGTIYLFST